MNKSFVRNEKIKQRGKLDKNFVWDSGKAILSFLQSLPEFNKCHNIMSYMSYRNEVPTPDIADLIINKGKSLVLPYTDNNFIIFPFVIDNVSQLKKSSMGIYEPDPAVSLPADPESIDMILVPGVAFDLSGNRLGFGKGCYDKFMPSLRDDCVIIGLSYEFQLEKEIPTDMYDIPMHIILTEERIIRII